MRQATHGKAFPQCVFDHWSAMNDDPLDVTTNSGKIVLATRARKGLKEFVPEVSNFEDKL